MRLLEYLSSTFPGLRLTPPLFYNWPISIRFELGIDQTGLAYHDGVLHRACSLYEAVFNDSDVCFIVSAVVRYVSARDQRVVGRRRKHKIPRCNVFQLSKRLALGVNGAAARKRIITNIEDDQLEITTLRWTEVAPLRIGYRSILEAKANDFYHLRRPLTDDRIYFVNLTRNIILHMYDDRGLDLVAPRRSDLQTIYDTHKAWVLDYDRTRIEEVFGQVGK